VSLSSRWLKHLPDASAKADYGKRLELMQDVWRVLRDILQEDLDAIEKDSVKKDHYFMPAWSEYQADRNGSKRAIKKIIDILPKGE